MVKMKPILTLLELQKQAKSFSTDIDNKQFSELYGTDNGKTVGTFLERHFKDYLAKKFDFVHGNAASGLDLPSVNVDIKCTSDKQPQSSCPFKNAEQKVYGLGYNLLVFVYQKKDNALTKTAGLHILHAVFIDKARTGDYSLTRSILSIINQKCSDETTIQDIDALLEDKNIPLDDMGRINLAKRLVAEPPKEGTITISNALQWRLQYGHAIELADANTYPNEVNELAQ